ncbi:uncharacterized protein BO80DRAFT_131535 [Aspergillus ibericus CBS 121593]|uniref:Uncharacterized protein n=1 Tax=Aspergillus ibericus CBS 121593 TaxID=1448316 RepID=A0A395HBK5_9EURO|nr:hypothetical protein BO80DRAFT_131535 [Aspergillus ibericus CBS 121593]RAL05232.1 hypothetical protein BO80DRAFT_131535 [Aspergillus ibericus CBS 121593]
MRMILGIFASAGTAVVWRVSNRRGRPGKAIYGQCMTTHCNNNESGIPAPPPARQTGRIAPSSTLATQYIGMIVLRDCYFAIR